MSGSFVNFLCHFVVENDNLKHGQLFGWLNSYVNVRLSAITKTIIPLIARVWTRQLKFLVLQLKFLVFHMLQRFYQ